MSVPAGSSRSPEEEALDRMEERAAGSGISDEDVATVRERLERLTAEIQAIVSVLPGLPQGMTPFEYAKATAERVDVLEAQVERLTEERDAQDARWQEFSRPFDKAEYDAMYEARIAAESEVSRLTAELQHTREGLREVCNTDWDANEGITPFQFEQRVHGIARRALLAGSSVARTEAQAENALLTGLLDKDGQPIQNAARALLRATDNAERNAALGDLYNLLAATPPSVGLTEGDGDCEHDYVFESDDPVTYRCDKCGARSDDGVYPRVGSFHPHKPLSGGGAK